MNYEAILEGTRLKVDNEADFPSDEPSEFYLLATKS